MRKFLLLIIGLLVLSSVTFAQAKKMTLTVNLQNALLTGKVEVKGNYLKRRSWWEGIKWGWWRLRWNKENTLV